LKEQEEFSPEQGAESAKENAEDILADNQESLSSLLNDEQIDKLLEESQKIAAAASISEGELEKLINESFKEFNKARLLNEELEAKIAILEEPPLASLRPDDYGELVKEELLTEEEARKLSAMDESVKKLKAIKNPPAAATEKLQILLSVRKSARSRLEQAIKAKQEVLAAENERTKNELLRDYQQKTEIFNEISEKIKDNPQVMDRLHQMARKELKAIEKRHDKKVEQLINECKKFIRLLSRHHRAAFNRLAEAVKNENFREDLVAADEKLARDKKNKEANNVFSAFKSRIVLSISEGEGDERIKSIREIVPWRMPGYFSAFNAMNSGVTQRELREAVKNGNERAQSVLARWNDVLAENRALRRLIGKEEIVDRKTGKKIKSSIYRALEIRQEEDLKGITEQKRKTRQEAIEREKSARKEMADIVARGGVITTETAIKFIDDKKVEIPKGEVAFRMKLVKTKKGKMMWEVAETFPQTANLKVGQRFSLNFSDASEWVKKAAAPKYRIMEKATTDEERDKEQ